MSVAFVVTSLVIVAMPGTGALITISAGISLGRPCQHPHRTWGAELADQAIGAELVDECHPFLCGIVVGGGERALPYNVRAELEVLAERDRAA